MSGLGSAIFDTAIGRCGIAWSEKGVVGIQLAEGSPQATGSRLARRFPGAVAATPPS